MWERLRPSIRPSKRQAHRLSCPLPTAESTGVIRESRLRDHTAARNGRITRRPGEQFSRSVASQKRIWIGAVVRSESKTQLRLTAVGVIAQCTATDGLCQGASQRTRRSKGHQRCTGIQQALRIAAQTPRFSAEIAPMGRNRASQGAGAESMHLAARRQRCGAIEPSQRHSSPWQPWAIA